MADNNKKKVVIHENGDVTPATVVAAAQPTVQSTDPDDEVMSVAKFFIVCTPPIHRYTRAALEEQYRGTLMTAREWKQLFAVHMQR